MDAYTNKVLMVEMPGKLSRKGIYPLLFCVITIT